jgi:hypothetical protein
MSARAEDFRLEICFKTPQRLLYVETEQPLLQKVSQG